MPDYSYILEKAKDLSQTIIDFRREFHRNPEPALKEFNTAGRVREILDGLGIDARMLVDGVGVRGFLKGSKPGKTIALRADMDALPIQEVSEASFKSRNPGFMHACGHDANTAMLLGGAMILSELRDRLPGNVVFIFQPAEETGQGAKKMIEHGAMDGVDGIFGMHINAETPTGRLGFRTGPIMAAGEFMDIAIKGEGGHGGYPHKAVDPVSIAAHVITALQNIVGREVSPLKSAVISVCDVKAGSGAYNIIPDSAALKGTIRYLDPDLGDYLAERIETTLDGITSAMRGKYEFKLHKTFPATINDETMTAIAIQAAHELLGGENVFEREPAMGSEDFSYYANTVPGAYFFLGARNEEKGMVHPHHHPRFSLDEDALHLGAALHAGFACNYLTPV